MEGAVRKLFDKGYFESLTPINEERLRLVQTSFTNC